MYQRHQEVPVFEYRNSEVDAVHFNHVQVALKRLGSEIHLPLPRLKTLELILQKDAWIIVDRAFNDLPVAAWTDFEVHHRDDLYSPIKCRLRLYHTNADLVLDRSLDAMELLLGEELADQLPDKGSAVLPFREKSPDSDN